MMVDDTAVWFCLLGQMELIFGLKGCRMTLYCKEFFMSVKRFGAALIIVLALAAATGSSFVSAAQEIKETRIIAATLRENFDITKRLFRISSDMEREAQPFTRPRHRARFRFEPSERHSREVLSMSRKLLADFRLLRGVLRHANLPERESLFKSMLESTDSLSVFAKRSLRAIRGNNYALYMASAQAIKKEAASLSNLIYQAELAINQSIAHSDSLKEDL